MKNAKNLQDELEICTFLRLTDDDITTLANYKEVARDALDMYTEGVRTQLGQFPLFQQVVPKELHEKVFTDVPKDILNAIFESENAEEAIRRMVSYSDHFVEMNLPMRLVIGICSYGFRTVVETYVREEKRDVRKFREFVSAFDKAIGTLLDIFMAKIMNKLLAQEREKEREKAIFKEKAILFEEISKGVTNLGEVLRAVEEGSFEVRASEEFSIEGLRNLAHNVNNLIATLGKERDKLTKFIEELSTPVLNAWEGVLVIPIIGTMTEKRAAESMERILEAVEKMRSEVVIIDITGVPAIDTMEADTMIKTIKALRILGNDAIITGITAEVASTLVKLGITLEGLITRATLRDGLHEAIKMMEERKKS